MRLQCTFDEKVKREEERLKEQLEKARDAERSRGIEIDEIATRMG